MNDLLHPAADIFRDVHNRAARNTDFFHPAANIFPMMEGDEFEALKEDIRQHGQQVAICYYDGKIIDGRNRWRACKELDIVPWESELDEDEAGDAIELALSLNLHRRHLTTSQRAMVAVEVKKLLEPEMKERMTEGGKKGAAAPKSPEAKMPQASKRNNQARDEAATALNVSPRTVDAAQKVKEAGDEQLIKDVQSGKTSVSKAAKLVTEKDNPSPTPAQPQRSSRVKQFRQFWKECSQMEQSIIRTIVIDGDL